MRNPNAFEDDGPLQTLENMIQSKGGGAPSAGFFDEYMNNLDDGSSSDNGIGSFMVAYRLTGEAKVQGVCDFIETLTDNGAKFLVFAHHKSVMDEIEKYLKHKKIGNVRVDGTVKTEIRHERVKAFQTNSQIRCAILSIMAASQGLTLTAASTIVFAELTWTPSILNQAEDRAHRIGQKNSVNIYYINGRGTVDDQIFSLVNYKQLVTTDVTDGFKTSLDIKQAELEELPIDELAKDGTII